jgi:hypothetical protein
MKAFALAAATLAALTALAVSAASSDSVRKVRDVSLELVGQFVNSPAGVTPPTHSHYGYLAYVSGLPAFKAAPENETTALFTFFAEAATLRVIADGPLRVITRVGKLTIYRDPSTNGTFAKADTFRDGTPVLVAKLRQQVVSNTVTGAFTTFHQNTIISTRSFRSGRGRVQLGTVGEKFTTAFNGHSNMPGPPSGFFAGYAVSLGRR